VTLWKTPDNMPFSLQEDYFTVFEKKMSRKRELEESENLIRPGRLAGYFFRAWAISAMPSRRLWRAISSKTLSSPWAWIVVSHGEGFPELRAAPGEEDSSS